ncbi:MAG TPA: hypothetical protein VEB41_15925 [Burkholderiales bacterium]|nr:hypothetical protein [Burkholderiales bacterium]
MITRRTLLIFNFGVAVLFMLVGLLSIYAMNIVRPASGTLEVPPAFSSTVLNSIAEEKDPEKLRSSAVFYYELARDFRKARYAASEGYLYDVRVLSFFVAGLFAIGGLLVLAPARERGGQI